MSLSWAGVTFTTETDVHFTLWMGRGLVSPFAMDLSRLLRGCLAHDVGAVTLEKGTTTKGQSYQVSQSGPWETVQNLLSKSKHEARQSMPKYKDKWDREN